MTAGFGRWHLDRSPPPSVSAGASSVHSYAPLRPLPMVATDGTGHAAGMTCTPFPPSLALAPERQVGAGARLLVQGRRSEVLYGLVQGRVRQSATDTDGRLQVLGFPGAGACLGLEQLAGGISPSDFEALTPCRVRVLPWRQLAATDWPVLAARLAAMLEERSQLVHALGQLSGLARLAGFLRDEARREALPAPRAVSGPGGQQAGQVLQLALPMSRGDIAAHLGLTLETVSRGFSALARSGVIAAAAPGARRLRVLDPGRLDALADETSARQRRA